MRRLPSMPTVAKVNGVKVLIYYSDHAPPHVHLSKGDDDAVSPIISPRIKAGLFSAADRRAVLSFIRTNETALLANWVRAQMGLPLAQIV